MPCHGNQGYNIIDPSAENEAEAYGYLMLLVASFDKTFGDAADIAMDEIKSRKTEEK